MHIILGEDEAKKLDEKYTVLELDRIQLAEDGPVIPSYCVVGMESMPLQEVTEIDRYKHLHTKLMENYVKKDWNFCEQALEHLHGRWGGSLNSFYDEISRRIAKYKEQDPGDGWNGILKRYTTNA